jgi:hypothetical protein
MRFVQYCNRCHRRRYCERVSAEDAHGVTVWHTWLCRPCSTFIGVNASEPPSRPFAGYAHALARQIAAWAHQRHASVHHNHDGTLTCIWITQSE